VSDDRSPNLVRARLKRCAVFRCGLALQGPQAACRGGDPVARWPRPHGRFFSGMHTRVNRGQRRRILPRPCRSGEPWQLGISCSYGDWAANLTSAISVSHACYPFVLL
jgi:hypothetical protein